MTKEITVADLKEHLDEWLEEVRNGTTLLVLEGERTVFEVRPPGGWIDMNGLRVRPAKGKMRDIRFPPPLEPEIDVVALIREDHDAR